MNGESVEFCIDDARSRRICILRDAIDATGPSIHENPRGNVASKVRIRKRPINGGGASSVNRRDSTGPINGVAISSKRGIAVGHAIAFAIFVLFESGALHKRRADCTRGGWNRGEKIRKKSRERRRWPRVSYDKVTKIYSSRWEPTVS